ncbi:glycosyltransferase [Thiocapsa rosea]|uniref:glycosyltransferase n=1 Tax=Thiocapsa rosea TaxID=69360 RepID=UPI001FEBBD17|nr:glycosyltransferase [Thiocapsa rosea]
MTHITLAAPAALRAFMPEVYDDFVDTAPLIRHGWFGSRESFKPDIEAGTMLIDEVRPDIALGMMHYSGAVIALGARRAHHRPRTAASFRGPISEYIRRYERGFGRLLFLRLVIGLAARAADRILVPSQGTADDTCRHFLGPRARTLVIPNGIDGVEVQVASREPVVGLEHLPPDLPMLCVAARLSREKDVDLLIEAFRRLQPTHPCTLAVVGDGPERSILEQRIRDWDLGDRVAFVGHRENVFPYMRKADIYVHTCQFEGFGYTMLEAMACGTPVLATDCPSGPREVLGAGRFGVLVAPSDAGALSSGIAGLLADPGRRERLSTLGMERAEDLSLARMAEGYQNAFLDMLRRRHPRSAGKA